MPRFLAAFLAVILPVYAAAQDQNPDTILVLDASGSMWGQIDGVNKIVIAREVIADVLTDLPDDLELGLMAYGHNRRGDCADIEMLIEPAQGTGRAIIDAVNAINPRGRTPMSDAVVAAAQALRHTENAATVILVSDGIESCDADPCAVAAELEAAGVGFTAHVIGFDVSSEPEARAQMQCLADTTGGEFLTADNAEELAAALSQVAVAPPPPAPANVTVTARVEDGSAPVSPLNWTLFDPAGTALLGPVAAPGFVVELPAGDYVVDVLRESQGTNHGTAFTVAAGEAREVVITLPALATPVTFEARLDTPDGPLITDPVLWSVYEISDTAGNPLTTDLPAGSYSVEAYWTATEQVAQTQISILGSDPRTVVVVFETPLPQATVIAPDTAVAGALVEVAWQGPDNTNDFIAVDDPANPGPNGINRTFTEQGSPLMLQMPPEPGTYEVRYVLDRGREVIATRSIEVVPLEVQLVAPDTAVAGAMVEVAWIGPDYANDFIAVDDPTDPGPNGINRTFTNRGNPLMLQMPTEPGSYEIRYVLDQDRMVVAARAIEVTDVAATLQAPETAPAGSTVEVAWTGPNYANDFIAVDDPTNPGPNGINRTFTAQGSPLRLQLPPVPGSYEIRYVLDQDREVIASRAIEVTDVAVSLVAPETAVAGSLVEVAWDGPDNANDFIAVDDPADPGPNGINRTFTAQGSPLLVQMPPEPGNYEIRYVLDQDREVIAARAITVTEVTASLEAPATAPAGETITVTWTGPDYPSDFIAVDDPTDPGPNGINRTFTAQGSPLQLQLPPVPGSYEIRYVLDQDRQLIAARSIEVLPVAATIEGPTTATIGETIEVTWTGPNYPEDFIAVDDPTDPSANGINRSFTANGNTIPLVMPAVPGQYELRYIIAQDRTLLASRTIEITDLDPVRFDIPPSLAAGDRVTLRHTGPLYANDFVAIAQPGEANQFETRANVNASPTVELTLPTAPGTYELRYYMGQGRTLIGTQEITVE